MDSEESDFGAALTAALLEDEGDVVPVSTLAPDVVGWPLIEVAFDDDRGMSAAKCFELSAALCSEGLCVDAVVV